MKIIVIGAGITGLSVAYYLNRIGCDVRIFEGSSEVGGLAGYFSINGAHLEKYYHHSFSGHTDLITLMRELNIENAYFYRNAKMGFYFKNRIYPFVTGKDLLSFKPLKLINRFRLGLTSLIMLRIKDWQKLEKKGALEWLSKYSGDEVCKIVWEPLLKMKFGDDYDRISAAWLWNRVVDRRRTGTNKDVLGYVKGGYKTLIDTLTTRIKGDGTNIHMDSKVREFVVDNGICTGVTVNGENYDADMVVSTISIPSFLKISPVLPTDYHKSLLSINYQGSVCLILSLKKSLSSYYWINVSDPKSPFVGLIEHTNLISPKVYGNNHLVYLAKYASPDSEIFSKSDDQIYSAFLSQIKKMFPAFNESDVTCHWVFRERYSQPVFVKNYSLILPKYRTPIENLYLLNTAQIYPQSRSLNSSIGLARHFVDDIIINNSQI